jgi:pimeloyl-[acyl-carrier protein] methyl ester esterase
MAFLERSGGGRLAYQELGAGPPVVLVHGWSLSSAVFADVAAALGRRHRVIAPDLRGHGGSDPAPFTLADLAQDLGLLLERLDLGRAALLGWSLGGQVALAALAGKRRSVGPERPDTPDARDRVTRLILVSSTPRFTAGDGWPHGLPAQHLAVLAHRVRRDPARTLARFFDDLLAPDERDPALRARAGAVRAGIPLPDPAAAQAGLDVLAATDLRPVLAGTSLPTLVVHGEADPICPAGAGRALAASIPGARLALLPGAGHVPFLSRPDAFAAALDPFLAEAG